MEQIQNGLPKPLNIPKKNRRTLLILISTIITLLVISVVYIIIYPNL
jgi:hypothetical protein